MLNPWCMSFLQLVRTIVMFGFPIFSSTSYDISMYISSVVFVQTSFFSPMLSKQTAVDLLVGTEKYQHGLVQLCAKKGCGEKAKQCLYKLLDMSSNPGMLVYLCCDCIGLKPFINQHADAQNFREIISEKRQMLKHLNFSNILKQKHTTSFDHNLVRLLLQCPKVEMSDLVPPNMVELGLKVSSPPSNGTQTHLYSSYSFHHPPCPFTTLPIYLTPRLLHFYRSPHPPCPPILSPPNLQTSLHTLMLCFTDYFCSYKAARVTTRSYPQSLHKTYQHIYSSSAAPAQDRYDGTLRIVVFMLHLGYVPPYYPSTLPQLEDRESARSRYGYPHIGKYE